MLNNSPDLFGYCGVQSLAESLLNYVTIKLDADSDFAGLSFAERSETALNEINEYMRKQKSTYDLRTTKFLHAGRDNRRTFNLNDISYSPQENSFESVAVNMDDIVRGTKTAGLKIIGSGKDKFKSRMDKVLANDAFNFSPATRSSRLFFQLFSEFIDSNTDPFVGAPIQLASLYTNGNGHLLGLIENDELYFKGKKFRPQFGDVDEWRNRRFEICDFRTKLPKENAQKQPPFVFRDKKQSPDSPQ